ncbi:DUF2157 domain-containing protein [uncultured Desulfobulbus sp.]|uniref:DUF2157 domain-containing protein n=1 Tax=uncultured Desulfobulbus sp. TaxID=239745 RepID=UPI0029C76F39|nr:DUF2157 domain-containing protein [uncultured Desulfobulbus sp.]
MQIQSKTEAQQRADQIESFRAELGIIEREHVVTLDTDQQASLARYHSQLLDRLAAAFDIDATNQEKQLSFGMRITSFLGALGLAASVYFLYFQYWGGIATKMQVIILVTMPILGLVLTMGAVRLEKSGYFSKLFALVSLVCFVLNLSMLGQIFNIAPTPNAFLIWAMFAFLLAYAADARLLLAMGIISFAAFLSAQAATWNGCYWISFGERPESFFPAALFLFLVPLLPHRRYTGFAIVYRVFAMLLFFLPVLILSNWGTVSYLELPKEQVEYLYQIIGFVVSAVAILLGIRKGWPEVVNTGNTFFTLFLYTKFYDWWWDWMPKYQFFLAIAMTAILMLLVLKWMRHASIRQKGEGAA